MFCIQTLRSLFFFLHFFISFKDSYTLTHTHTHNAGLHPFGIPWVTVLLWPSVTQNIIYQAEDEGEEDCEVPGELARLLLQ